MIRSSAAARMLSMLSRAASQNSAATKTVKRTFQSTGAQVTERWSASVASRRQTGLAKLPMWRDGTSRVVIPGVQWRPHSHGHSHGHSHDHDGPSVKIKFVYEKEKDDIVVDAPIGMNVLRVAQAHEVELEGACECSLACSTCHVILEDEVFDRLEEPTDDENDMLDLAFGLTDTSRLGCQIIVTEDMEGAVFRIPSATRNMYVDGHVPKPH